MADWIDCATLAQAKGLDGGLVAKAAAGLPFLLSEGAACALVPPQLDAPRNVTVESVVPRGDDEAVVFFAEVADRTAAEALTGCHCLMRAEEVDLASAIGALAADALACEGYEVVDEAEGPVGIVEGLEESPGQMRLAVRRPDGRMLLVPLVDAIVVAVDDDLRRMDVRLPAGLLDL